MVKFYSCENCGSYSCDEFTAHCESCRNTEDACPDCVNGVQTWCHPTCMYNGCDPAEHTIITPCPTCHQRMEDFYNSPEEREWRDFDMMLISYELEENN